MAVGLDDDGRIDTIEFDDELEGVARSFFDRSPHRHKIALHIGSALETAPELLGEDEFFEMVFIDGDKRQYADYYRMTMGDAPFARPLVRSGSVIVADNILWYGKVAGPTPPSGDSHTRGILEFNDMVVADPRVENVIVPIRDGLNLVRVK
jgi:caffeoyl-CoA O-methyltransferase